MDYWRKRRDSEGELSADHYVHFYTSHFDITTDEYEGKVIADIGCGPRGSLEWADMAKRRIGIDPLADQYATLRSTKHKMEYICAGSEEIPLETDCCDAVFSFNSLDHVDSVEKAVREIKRLTKPGGLFLLIIDVNHTPNACEPHRLSPQKLVDLLAPEFSLLTCENFVPTQTNCYQSILNGKTFEDKFQDSQEGFFTAKFRKQI